MRVGDVRWHASGSRGLSDLYPLDSPRDQFFDSFPDIVSLGQRDLLRGAGAKDLIDQFHHLLPLAVVLVVIEVVHFLVDRRRGYMVHGTTSRCPVWLVLERVKPGRIDFSHHPTDSRSETGRFSYGGGLGKPFVIGHDGFRRPSNMGSAVFEESSQTAQLPKWMLPGRNDDPVAVTALLVRYGFGDHLEHFRAHVCWEPGHQDQGLVIVECLKPFFPTTVACNIPFLFREGQTSRGQVALALGRQDLHHVGLVDHFSSRICSTNELGVQSGPFEAEGTLGPASL